MRPLTALWNRIRALFEREDLEAEMEEEIAFHLERQVEKYMAEGMPEAEARRRARVEFGGVDRHKEEVRRAWGTDLLFDLAGDVRFALRQLRRYPGFALVAILTLAVGIGGTTAAFSVLDRVVLRPLPYPDPSQLYVVGLGRESSPGRPSTVSDPMMAALIRSPGPAQEIAGITRGYSVLSRPGDPERIYPSEITSGFFELFGATPLFGRLFDEEDHGAGAAPVAVLDYGFWRGRFGSEPDVIGETVVLDDVAHQVVGVLSPEFVPPEHIMSDRQGGIWIPRRLGQYASMSDGRPSRNFTTWLVARLPSADLADEMALRVDRVLEEVYGDEAPFSIAPSSAQPLQAIIVGPVRDRLWQVLAAVSLLFVIASVNVAGLMLTRASERQEEFAVRHSLGAGRRRLLRQLLCESSLLAFIAGITGSVIAYSVIAWFTRVRLPGSSPIPRLAEVSVDLTALAFSLAASLAAVLLFGLLPALRSTRRLTGSSRHAATHGREAGRLRTLFVLAETALTVVLVVGSGLLVHDLLRRISQDPGYVPEGLVAVGVDLPYERYGYSGERVESFWADLSRESRRLPGVRAASLTSEIPANAFSIGWSLRPEGHDDSEMTSIIFAGEDFHTTVRFTLIEGEWLPETSSDPELPAVVNQAFVETYWPEVSTALGRTIGGSRQHFRVVGVAGDMQVMPGHDPRPKVFVPLASRPSVARELLVRLSSTAPPIAPALRNLIRELDPALVDVDIRSLPSLNAQALARPRFYTLLLSGFGLAAFLLALIGVYGTTAYSVRSRSREIGIRLALGARRSQVVAGVLVRVFLVLAIGTAIGLMAAYAGSRVLADVLRMLEPRDPVTFVVVAAVMCLAGVVAALIPAARVSSVDPASTLRIDT